ncbi:MULTISPECIES: MbtH family protein [Burkholderia]|uniref:Protein mbtH n=1 Tax=Burkholderia savannae TaxID=1637837 RepID=A0ABR5T7H8_9BURK|nr:MULTISPECIES: MbtH family protein [Burkholderia]AOJ72544.1 protein mbtH [Burkholderia savannae]AOJ82810.1 protein mbtH [Burkholderia savannae]AOK50942.1 protein mbtH [Burkholderia sp. MSMB617WGS]KGR96523.1 mbtH-like family protein [Burkholderia sp. ABCPW 111]KVG38551.1 protein mbtH [Burkholderia sp. MSMB0265]
MTNLLDDPDGTFVVLSNAEGQHSLWPASIAPPAGWSVVFGQAARQPCVDYLDAHWTDLTPRRPHAA